MLRQLDGSPKFFEEVEGDSGNKKAGRNYFILPRSRDCRARNLLHRLGIRDAQSLRHFVVEKSLPGPVGLHPLSIDDKLRDRALARVADHFLRGPRGSLDVDLFEGDVVLGEKALGLAAVRAPKGGVNNEFHEFFTYDVVTCRQVARHIGIVSWHSLQSSAPGHLRSSMQQSRHPDLHQGMTSVMTKHVRPRPSP